MQQLSVTDLLAGAGLLLRVIGDSVVVRGAMPSSLSTLSSSSSSSASLALKLAMSGSRAWLDSFENPVKGVVTFFVRGFLPRSALLP